MSILNEKIAKFLLQSKAGQQFLGKFADSRLQMIPSWKAGQPIWAPWSTERAIQEGLKMNVWVYACCRKIAQTASSIPWFVEQKKADGTWEAVPGHPIEILLKEPNNTMSGQDLFERLTYHLYLGGNGLWHMPLFKGVPVELWPVNPDKIKPVPSKQAGIIDHYEYKVSGGMAPTIIPPEEITHFMFVDPSDIYWGLAPLQAAARTVDTDNEAVNWNKISMQNRAVADGVFTFEHPLVDDQWTQAREQVKTQHQGSENARSPWVLGAGAKWQQMSLTPIEMDFIKSRRWSVYEICAVFNVDPLCVGVPDSSSRANKKEARRALWEDTVIPYLEDLRSNLDLCLIPYWDPAKLRADKEATLRVNYDLTNVAALKEILFEKMRTALGFYKMRVPFNMINDRLELGFDSVPGGDEPAALTGAGASDTSEPKANHKPYQTKADIPEEEIKMLWKVIDEDRVKWEDKTEELTVKRFKSEETAVVSAFNKGGEKAAIKTIEKQAEDWDAMLKAVFNESVKFFGIKEFNRLDNLKMEHKIDFNIFEAAVQAWIIKNAAREAAEISATSQEKIAKTMAEGVAANETNIQIAKRIKDQYKRWYDPATDTGIDTKRATTIARTEINAAQGFGTQSGGTQAAKELDLDIVKRWTTSRDVRVREEHRSIDGQTRPLKEKFSNGLLFNGDPQGSAKERINCRCVVIHIVKRRA